MTDLMKLVSSQPDPGIVDAIRRVHQDAVFLRSRMTAAEVRSEYPMLEQARDALSIVLDRAEADQ